jgi:hypothetical protein
MFEHCQISSFVLDKRIASLYDLQARDKLALASFYVFLVLRSSPIRNGDAK